MAQLIIAEKPNAATKIASALGVSNKIGKRRYYFHGEVGGKETYVVPAVGHLYGLSESKKRQGYPALEVHWVPTHEKKAKFSKPYLNQFKKLAKKADEIIIATDFDREGAVIGYNLLRFIFKKKDAKRMKFSTLTATELRKSYKTASEHIDSGQVEAGITRHKLDFFWGISLSKAATGAVSKAMNSYRQLSIGRVQGPALAILAEKEKEIAAFKSKPYWQIFADLDIKGKQFEARHKTKRFWKKGVASGVFAKVKDKPAKVVDIKKRRKKILPPTPFNLTALQMEAYRCFGMSPKRTLTVAQRLYSNALISYPRTSSQKLPASIGYSKILKKLAGQKRFTEEANIVIKSRRKPRQGKKKDSAHPAIYPTGEFPKSLASDELKVYDLVVRRFLACFGKAGEREYTKVLLNIASEPFILRGKRTTKIEWQRLYHPYSKQKELELPVLRAGETYGEQTRIEEKETKPPKRYTPASIIRALEKKDVGTKATRANIIDILYRRNYVDGKYIEVTDLGLAVVDTFSKFAPSILSVGLTARFEKAMDKIQDKQISSDAVLSKAKKVLIDICKEFDEHKENIGKALAKALKKTEKEQRQLCVCPKCGKGHMRVIRSRKTKKRFLACDEYPKCKNTWPLPQRGGLKTLDKKCKDCGLEMVAIYKKGRRPWHLCANPKCPGKKDKDKDKKKKSKGKKSKTTRKNSSTKSQKSGISEKKRKR